MIRTAPLVLLLSALALPSPSAAAAADRATPQARKSVAPPADLSGTWILDPSLSHEAERRFSGRDEREGPEGGERRMPSPRTGSPGDERDEPDGTGEPNGDTARRRFERLTIAVDPAAGVTITYGDGEAVKLAVGSGPSELEGGRGKRTVEAHWSDEGDLVVHTTSRDRTTSETYVLTHDRKLLTVLVEGRTAHGTLDSRRVYRPIADVPGAGER